MPHHSTRLHEPVALGALFAAGVSLHVLWIANLITLRAPGAARTMSLVPELGPASGLFALCALVYAVVFLGTVALFRGRDCEPARDGVFWFFLSSVVAFALLTLPFVAGFSATLRLE